MADSNILPLLLQAGLTDKESALYLAGIELGEATIQQLAEFAGLKRPTAYEIMSDLEKKGLFFATLKGKKRMFVAEDPERILAILKTRQEAFVHALPDLKTLYHTGGNKPQVRFYEGTDGLKAMYWDTLESKGPVLAYGAIAEMWSAVSKEFIQQYVKERAKRRIFMRGIVPNTAEAQEYVKNDPTELRQLLLVPKDQFTFSNEINIYNDKIAIFSFPEKIGLIIESKKIAETQRAIFELAWLGASQT